MVTRPPPVTEGAGSGTHPAADRGPLQVRHVPLGSLAPDPANARTHPQANLDAIVASLRRFGQAEPLVVQAGTRRVVAGHGRLAAMQALGWTMCNVVELDLSGTDATALGIALNRTAELAEWDDGALARILQQLHAEDGGLEGVGYSTGEIDELLAQLEGAAGKALDDRGPMAPPVNPVSRLGDLWQLGEHCLLCGDATKADDVARVMGGEGRRHFPRRPEGADVAHLPDDAFERYAALGAGRTYQALADQLGISKRTVVRHALADRWQERLAQVERDGRAKAEARLTESVAAVTERHLRTLHAVQHKALQALTSAPLGTATQAAATLIAAVRAERAIVAPAEGAAPWQSLAELLQAASRVRAERVEDVRRDLDASPPQASPSPTPPPVPQAVPSPQGLFEN